MDKTETLTYTHTRELTFTQTETPLSPSPNMLYSLTHIHMHTDSDRVSRASDGAREPAESIPSWAEQLRQGLQSGRNRLGLDPCQTRTTPQIELTQRDEEKEGGRDKYQRQNETE